MFGILLMLGMVLILRFFGELPKLFYDKIVPIDGVFISITPPDENGYCSLGVSGEACLAAMEHAKYICCASE